MVEGQKDQKSKQAGAKSSKAAGTGGMGPEKNLGTSHGHANGVGEIYEEEGFGVNEAMSEAAMDDAVLDNPVSASPSDSSGGANSNKGAQGGGRPGQVSGKSGRNPGKKV